MTASAAATIGAAIVHTGPGAGAPLSPPAQAALLRTVVDTHLHLPDMFELTFLDNVGDVVNTAGLGIGAQVRIEGCSVADSRSRVLISGEVTAIEARCQNLNTYTVARGYDLCHRLQRTRRTRTFVNATDSDIARQLARAAGILELDVTPSSVVHDHIGQVDQTDWDFLKHRAREIGYEVGISAGILYFRPASSTGERHAVRLRFRENLRLFRPRITAGNLAPKVELRVWDALPAKVVNSVAETGSVRVGGQTATDLASQFVPATTAAATQHPRPASASQLGPAPEPTANVVYDRPVASGAAIGSAAKAAVDGLASHLGSTFAEADGEALGDPAIAAGAALTVEDVPSTFAGPWTVTNACHVFDLADGGYTTHFVASGRHDRSLLGLASLGGTQSAAPRLPGVYCGVVTNNNDPMQKSRVKVTLPWLSPDYETDWSPVAQVGAGRRSGALFLPEVGDEVVVAFEYGDPRRAYVLGGLVNNASSYSLGGPAVKATGQSAEVVLRGLVSAAGNRLVFSDELPPGSAGPPSASAITLGTGDGALSLAIDQVAGTVTLTCEPTSPNSRTEQGQINIRCGTGGTINIAAGAGGNVTVDGGANLSLKAQSSITIQSLGELTLKGSKITLN